MKNLATAWDIINILDENVPQMLRKMSRVIVMCADGSAQVFTESSTHQLHPEQLFIEGDVLLCCRNSVMTMSDSIPKGPFAGKCKMVDAHDAESHY